MAGFHQTMVTRHAHEELTTQQAAELLNVSEAFVVALLDEGQLSSRVLGTARSIAVADLVAFKEADDRRRRTALDELTAEAQKLRLGYR